MVPDVSNRTRVFVKAACALIILAACRGSTPPTLEPLPAPQPPDARVGLKGGLTNADEAVSNLRVLSRAPSPPGFRDQMNSDLAFTGTYAIQGNFNGLVIWDITNPSAPQLVATHRCPASQNDVSVFRHLLFVSVESNGSRLDCTDGLQDTVSAVRMRGVRIFDITDVRQPKLVANVQTCRGSHTHTVVEDPADRENVYVYISGSANVRSPAELPACASETPDRNSNSALMRVEIIKVPIANPERALVVNRANIFSDLKTPSAHGPGHDDSLEVAAARAAGAFIAKDPTNGEDMVLGSGFVRPLLDSIVKAHGGVGAPTAADSAALRAALNGHHQALIWARHHRGNRGDSELPLPAVPRHHGLHGAPSGGRRMRRPRIPHRHH